MFTFIGFTSSDKYHYQNSTNSPLGNKHLGSVFYYKKHMLAFIMRSSFHSFSTCLACLKVYNSFNVSSVNYIKIIPEWSMKGQISDALIFLGHPRVL